MFIDPPELCGNLFFDRALHVFRKDGPCVGFDFEVLAGCRVLQAPMECFPNVVTGRAEGCGGKGIERDVVVDAGLLEIILA